MEQHGHDQPAPDGQAGTTGSPTGPVFRDGPQREPRSWGALALTALPPVVLAVVVLVIATR